MLFLSPRTVANSLNVSPSTHHGFFFLSPLSPVPLPTTLELQVHTAVSNIEYFAVLPTRELKMPLITVSPSILSFAILAAAQQCRFLDSPLWVITSF